MKHIACSFVVILAGLLFGCQSPESKDQEPLEEPKTFFGKDVKSVKDVSKSVSKSDQKTKRQAEELLEE